MDQEKNIAIILKSSLFFAYYNQVSATGSSENVKSQ
jgi:hypothetical protein